MLISGNIALAAAAVLFLNSPAPEPGTFHVSPGGSDANPGTAARPFATVEKARQAIQEARAQSPSGESDADFVVQIHGGRYRLKDTLAFGLEDRGIYQAVEGERPVITSAHPLPGEWRAPAPEEKAALLEAAREAVRAIDLPESRRSFHILYYKGKPLQPARSRGYRQLDAPPESVPYRQRRAIDEKHLYLPPEALRDIPDFTGAAMIVVPRYPWVVHRLPMSEVNRETGLVWSRVPGTYPLNQPAFGHFPDGTLWIENVPAVLDEPGEWVVDRENGRLLFWPPDAAADLSREVEIPHLTELLSIEGQIQEYGDRDEPAANLKFIGLTFTGADAYAWPEDKQGWGLQHDWEMYDRSTAMVRLKAAEDCEIRDCHFMDSGSAGLRLDLHCQKNIVDGCEFRDLGGVGVLLAGYGLGMKDVNRGNTVRNCVFDGIGQYWWHSPALFVWQSGHNTLTRNRIINTPYTAIVISGRTQPDRGGFKESSKTIRWDEFDLMLGEKPRTWENREPLMHGRENEVAYNDISACMQRMGDGNAIYISGTGKGNRVHHNYIHDIDSASINAAIRCDDDQHDVTIKNNIIAQTCGEGFIFKGRNVIVNNIIYDLRSQTSGGVPCVHQRGYLVLSGAPVKGSIVRRNLFVSTEPGQPILYEYTKPWKKGRIQMPPVTLASCEADHNLYFNAADPDWARAFLEEQRSRGVEENSLTADPEFADPANGDFSLEPGSLAVEKLGLEPIDLRWLGPQETPGGGSKRDQREASDEPPDTDPDTDPDPATDAETQAARKLRDIGVSVFLDFQTGHVKEVNATGNERLRDEHLALLSHFLELTDLSLEDTATTDAGLAHLARLPKLEWLNLYRTGVGDEGLRAVGRIPSLTHLPAGETQVTDKGLKALSNLEHLQYLGLRSDAITDAGVAQIVADHADSLTGLHLGQTFITDEALPDLAKLTRLEELYLHDTAVTDAGLQTLETFTSLKKLHLQRTQTSAHAISQLRSALPTCEIYWESDQPKP